MGDYAEEQILEALAVGDQRKARLWKAIKAEGDKAPPLTCSQIAQLTILLRPASPPLPTRAALRKAA